MGYPNYPSNRLIVDGVDITEKFKMVLSDGYTLSPPEPKTYVVDIPGGNGSLDLTESLFGDTTYNNREQEFVFYSLYENNFESIKTELSNFLHGKSFDYKITMDPDYTYHGRFTVEEYNYSMYSSGKVGVIKIKISSDPFKQKSKQIYKLNAIGGNIFIFKSGRQKVRPIIETNSYTKVIFNNKLIILTSGTYKLNDVVFKYGSNQLYINSYSIKNLKWGDLKLNSITWGEFKTRKLYEWYKSEGTSNLVTATWGDISTKLWSDLSSKTWADQMYRYEDTYNISDIYLKYDWGDL